MAKKNFIDNLLQEPSYKWQDEHGNLIVPSGKQLWQEAFKNINIFRSKKNWITSVSWLMVMMMFPLFCLFIFKYFSWPLAGAMVLYSMIIMGTHGTIWFHRFCTH